MPSDAGLKARKLQLVVDQIDNLPTLPVVATRLLALAASENSSARDLTQIIESDPSLTSRILALVNSAGFSRGKTVSSVDRAVTLLGFEAIRNSILSLKVFDHFNRRGSSPFRSTFDRRGFWRHSLAVAGASQMIARRVRGASPESAFVAGLLHDIGKVALDYALPKTFDQVARRVRNRRVTFAAAEAGILGADHTAIGKRLTAAWEFPEELINVVWLHHQPLDGLPETLEGRRLVEVVHLANLMARQQRIGTSSPPPDARVVEEAALRLKLQPSHLEAVGKEVRAIVAEHVGVLGLEKADERDLFFESLASANAELGTINRQMMLTSGMLERRQRHGRILAGMGRAFAEARNGQEMFAVLARTLCEGLGTNVCAAYGFGEDGGYVEGTVCRADRAACEHFLTGASDGVQPMPARDRGYGLVRAEQTEGWLFERLGQLMGQGTFYSFPLCCGQAVLGAVVFRRAADRPAPTRDEVDDVAALADTAALALALWLERRRHEAMVESLAGAQRTAADAQEELLTRRYLASVGAMAAGAAHEINNPLAVVSGRAQMLADTETDGERRRSLEIIQQQAERASGIVSELMSFARPPAAARRMTDLAVVLRKTIEATREAADARGVELAAEVPADLPPAHVDGAQIEWALRELVTNALAATPDGGRITVAAVHEPDARLTTLSVADTGSGMDGETLARACDPFFSGRQAGRRRGLGLAKVQRVAEANAATLQLDSSPDAGTTASLAFDLAEAPQTSERPVETVA